MTMQPDPLDFLKDVDVRLSVELGAAQMKLRSVMGLRQNSVVVLDRLADELLDVMVNGQRIARGEVIVDGNRFGLRIVEMAGQSSVGTMPTPPAHGAGFDESALAASAAPAGGDAR